MELIYQERFTERMTEMNPARGFKFFWNIFTKAIFFRYGWFRGSSDFKARRIYCYFGAHKWNKYAFVGWENGVKITPICEDCGYQEKIILKPKWDHEGVIVKELLLGGLNEKKVTQLIKNLGEK